MNRLITAAVGDVVDVIAPASACDPERLRAGVALLRSWKLAPRVPADLFGPKGIVAHRDAVRWRHLERALAARDSKLIWCVRGGYGSLRLLPCLRHMQRPARQKLLLGYSDITLLQAYVTAAWGWVALHAPVVGQLARGELPASSVAELKRVLFGRQTELVFSRLRRLNDVDLAGGVVSGRLAGGNLKSIQSTLGTPWQLPSSPLILFFEDTGERGYAIDRMLTQLRLAGVFERTKAMVLGSFTGGRERDGGFTGTRVLEQFARSVRFPVVAGMPVGHGKRFRPLPLGMTARLELRPPARLSIRWQAIPPARTRP